MVDLSIVFCMFTRGYCDLPKHPNVRGFSFHVACQKHQRLVGWNLDFGGTHVNPLDPFIFANSWHQFYGISTVGTPRSYHFNKIQCYWILILPTVSTKSCKKLLYKHLIFPYSDVHPTNRKWVIDKPIYIYKSHWQTSFNAPPEAKYYILLLSLLLYYKNIMMVEMTIA